MHENHLVAVFIKKKTDSQLPTFEQSVIISVLCLTCTPKSVFCFDHDETFETVLLAL